MPVYDRIPSPKDKRDYKLADYIDFIAPMPTKPKEWNDATILNQNPWGHCLGFSIAGFCNAAPIEDALTNEQGHGLYYKAKELDGEPGAEDGSTVRTGTKVLNFYGYIGAYAFAGSLNEIKRWVLTNGTLVVGTDFYYSMEKPDSNGVVHASGQIAGGHAYLLDGFDPKTNLFKFANSWGNSFGINGFFYMDADEWWAIFQSNGEAMTAVETGTGQPIPSITPPLVPQVTPQGNGCLDLLASLLQAFGAGTSQAQNPVQ